MCQCHKHVLGNLGGNNRQLDLSQGGGIDQIRVALYEFRKRRFHTALGIFAKELGVRLWLHLTQ